MALAIEVDNLSKVYQLGDIGTGTLISDFERWYAKVRGKEDPFLPNNKFLHEVLLKKGIHNILHIWEGEAHRPRFWQQMVQYFL